MYVDSHVHFWALSRGDYGWLKPSNPVLYRDYLPEHLLPKLQERGVEGVIAVQAAPTEAEARFLLELSLRYPIVVGVSAGLDPFAATFAASIERLRESPAFKGVRLNGSDFLRAQADEEARSKLEEALRLMERARLTLDVLLRPDALAAVAERLSETPALRCVVNHLGCPGAGSGEPRDARWSEGMKRLAALPSVSAKLSGMLTLSERPEPLRPYVDELFDRFGSARLLFGSDWPVALQAGGYDDVVERFESLLPAGLGADELRLLRAGNARRIYGLGDGE
ncbi:amidohydrolase family protein [Paenibacillus antri]|nr:amidohydrolase family protein [Paenibacillus antri]